MAIMELAAGKTKTVSASGELGQVILTFRDDITAGDGKKHDILQGKGKVNVVLLRSCTKFSPSMKFQTTSSNRLTLTDFSSRSYK